MVTVHIQKQGKKGMRRAIFSRSRLPDLLHGSTFSSNDKENVEPMSQILVPVNDGWQQSRKPASLPAYGRRQ
tara:strand:+ start:3994 stop:4209 length:216 start_codon:yes stop_codon:yes gene_type:complete